MEEEIYSLDSILGQKPLNKQRTAHDSGEEEEQQLINENTTFNKSIRISYKKSNTRESRNYTHKHLPFKGDKSSVSIDISDTHNSLIKQRSRKTIKLPNDMREIQVDVQEEDSFYTDEKSLMNMVMTPTQMNKNN